MHGLLKKNRGFTLVELVVILVIVGILAVVAVPRFGSSFDTRGYFDQLTAAARYAQDYAVASGCPVTFTIAANNFSVTRPANANCTGGAVPLAGPDIQAFAGNAPAGVSATAVNMVFAPDSTASSSTTVTVSGGGFSDSFTIHAATGYVEVN